MIVSIVIWIVIDAGNRADKQGARRGGGRSDAGREEVFRAWAGKPRQALRSNPLRAPAGASLRAGQASLACCAPSTQPLCQLPHSIPSSHPTAAAHQAVLDARLHPRPTNATSRRSLDLERLTELARAAAAAANGRDGGGSTSGDLAGDGGAAYSSTGGGSGGSAYTEKLYFREGAGGGSLRKRMQQL